MITRQHTALFFMALKAKGGNITKFKAEIPWCVLPDAIRAYIAPRRAGHFEKTPDGNGTSYMVYPNSKVLKTLTKENAHQSVEYHIPEGVYPKCVIGEDSDLEMFDIKNYGHAHFEALRCHIVQDIILDKILREKLIYAEKRFSDQFTLRCNQRTTINGEELRDQIAKFENHGFIHLAGKVYEKTGVILNNKWFEENVHKALLKAYPEDLAENTYKYMVLPEDVDARITAKKFAITDEEKDTIYMVYDLDAVLDEMYSVAYIATFRQL